MVGGYPPFRNATIKIGAMLPKKVKRWDELVAVDRPGHKGFPGANDLSGPKITGAGTID